MSPFRPATDGPFPIVCGMSCAQCGCAHAMPCLQAGSQACGVSSISLVGPKSYLQEPADSVTHSFPSCVRRIENVSYWQVATDCCYASIRQQSRGQRTCRGRADATRMTRSGHSVPMPAERAIRPAQDYWSETV